MGQATSSVLRTIFSSSIFSRSRTMTGPSLDLMAIFGKTIFACLIDGSVERGERERWGKKERKKRIL